MTTLFKQLGYEPSLNDIPWLRTPQSSNRPTEARDISPKGIYNHCAKKIYSVFYNTFI
ncbi:hypothetical protein [Microcoleus anatoxicus]